MELSEAEKARRSTREPSKDRRRHARGHAYGDPETTADDGPDPETHFGPSEPPNGTGQREPTPETGNGAR